MVAVNQNDLRIKNAENFIRSLNGPEGEARSYVFIGRATQWDSDVSVPMTPRQVSGDASPPYPENNFRDFYKVHDQMLSMKRINDIDAYHMIPRVSWASGVTYDMYRHDYNEYRRSTSNAKNLYDAVYYVITNTRDVYVCLDNNKGGPSTVEPRSTTDEPFYTSDNYQWMRLYSVPSTNLINNSTNNYIPVTDENVVNTTSGCVFTITIDSPGADYTSNPAGITNRIPFYYCNITGDGSGGIARVTVLDGRVVEIRVVETGQDYTWAKLDFTARRVYQSIGDLKNQVNGLDPLGDGTFVASVVICPPGGWGYEKLVSNDPLVFQRESRKAVNRLARQLGAVRVGVFSRLNSELNDFVIDTQFRQLGIVQDIEGFEINNSDGTISYPDTLSACYAVKVKELVGSSNQNYIVGETITQTKIDPIDPTVRYEAKATVVGWNPDENILRYIQDASIHYDPNHNKLFPLIGTDNIIGDSSVKESTPDTDFGAPDPIDSDGITFDTGYAYPEYKKYSGIITYLSNQSPIQRIDSQTERVSLIITY